MNKKLKRFVALTTGLAIALSVAGCASTPASEPLKFPQIPRYVAQPEPQPNLTNDLIPLLDKKGIPVTITDELGKYQKVTINPDDETMRLDPAIVADAVSVAGWSDDDVLSAQQFIAKFVAEQGIDSIAVDGDGWTEWLDTTAETYMAPEWAYDMVDHDIDSDRSTFITNNANHATATLIRDGSPRIQSSVITVSEVRNLPIADAQYPKNLVFSGTTVTEYRATDEAVIAAVVLINPDATKDDILATYPKLADGVEGTFITTMDFAYSVRPDENRGWLITGYQNVFQSRY